MTALRVALFSGNYNYVLDGANQALNRLVGHLERRGAAVRVYAPTVAEPAFAPTGTLISVPSIAVPRRSEYRIAGGLTAELKADLDRFAPTLVHLSAPDLLGRSALAYAQRRGCPVVASVHTRFETYLRYYGLGWAEPLIEKSLARLYNKCDALLVTTDCMRRSLAAMGVDRPMLDWARGVDRLRFGPHRRSLSFRARHGLAANDVVIGFCGRLVLEKGLANVAESVRALRAMGLAHRVLVVGDGPERAWFERQLPEARFTGFLTGTDLAEAYAAMDVFFNPSITEAFGNVTLEAMASGVPVVAAAATGARALVTSGETGLLVQAATPAGFADALAALVADADLRQRLGARAVQVAAGYDWTEILDGVMAHYRSLIGVPELAAPAPVAASGQVPEPAALAA
jgi:glycosyltransferase involved in cell wall biosynthesis